MPMPCFTKKHIRLLFTSERNVTETYNNAIRAGDSGAAALRARPDTDDADRAAVQAKRHVDVLEDDAEEAEQLRTRSRVGLQSSLSSANGKI
jgi:hypothetical protein